MRHQKFTQLAALVTVAATFSATARAADWAQVQDIKKQLLATAAQHAIEQQKTTAAEPVAIPFPDTVSAAANLTLADKSAKQLHVKGNVSPYRWQGGQPDVIKLELPAAIDMFSQHTGLALIVHADPDFVGEARNAAAAHVPGTSPEVRIGVRLIADDGSKVEILPAVLLASAWGAEPHEIYFDWAFGNYAEEDTPKAVATLEHIKTIEFTFGGIVRAPGRGASKSDQPVDAELSNLRLVDYLEGSYDNSRFDLNRGKDLTLQQRSQEVTGIVIKYGGDKGVQSGIDSLDLLARTQCWDGSFLDGRRGANTVASGEYTFGFTIYGSLEGYNELRKMKSPALREKITIGPDTLTRDAFYQRMFYRAALSRTAAIPSKYRDDIIGGDTLMYGANRVLGYAVAMRMVADALDDPAQKAEVLAKYKPIMQEIADAQGRYSGGFPLLGEGDIYKGKGIHYDAGYTRTHMDILVCGVHNTGDPLLLQMLEKYQTVFQALMDEKGAGIIGMLSERHPVDEPVELIIPDLTAQVGLKYHLPIIAQWGYNDGIPAWKTYQPGKPLNHFTYIARVRGYPLGAHSQFLLADTQPDPEPKDLGYLFPRQYPIWSARIYDKSAPEKPVRTSTVTLYPDGHSTSDFKIDVGEFPFTVGVPVTINSPNGNITCEAVELTGWPKLLPDGAGVVLTGAVNAQGKINQPIPLTLNDPHPVTISFTSDEVKLPEAAGGKTVRVSGTFILTPEHPGQKIELTIHNGVTESHPKIFPQK